MEQKLNPPVANGEKQVIFNDEYIKQMSILPLFTKEKVKKWIVTGHNPKSPYFTWLVGEFQERMESVIDVSKLDEGYFSDHINRASNYGINCYLRAIVAGYTHREARYYMLWKENQITRKFNL